MSKKDFQNGFALGMASGGVVEVVDTTEIDNLETLIDESGVLEGAEGTATEKVEQLIDKANELDVFQYITNNEGLFGNAKKFPTKAVVNLPNVKTIQRMFYNWNVVPMVEEIIINISNSNTTIDSLSQVFLWNYCVKKVVLNLPNTITNMNQAFYNNYIEEFVINFSTKNVTIFDNCFQGTAKLKKIIGVLDFSNATSTWNMFSSCGSLEVVTFAPNSLSISISLQQSAKLTNESIQSIIDGLKPLEEGATAKTLTLNYTIKLTDEQKATINAKAWTLAQ